ncbi:hypothetical protein [Oceanisphaera pacifica]|uniref:Uncharacterized protein n=1 Tax=Oceanisphaera pacifica TaxID=2818389 RepID=A0ABS3NC62_9GAMM|nr:hypothetical protein [Oceanisphaera pacifica]MBO1518189.1 hypothetical protein [Oceanisphaera pacifica]
MLLKYYSGMERRQRQRRQILDRRDLLRWPPDEQDRRILAHGRRKIDNAKSMWDQ